MRKARSSASGTLVAFVSIYENLRYSEICKKRLFTATDRSDLLQQSFQRVTADTVCEGLYQTTLAQHFCAKDIVQLSNMCIGDVGVGFVTYVRGRPTVTGITSYVREICGTTSPTGFTRVQYYRDWIRTVTQL